LLLMRPLKSRKRETIWFFRLLAVKMNSNDLRLKF